MSRVWSGTAYSAISGVNQAATQVHTIAAWIYVTSASQGDGIYANNAAFTDYIWLGFDNTTGNEVVFAQGKSSAITEVRSSLTLNAWTHLCGVYDGTNINFYVNGASVGTPTAFNPSGRPNFTMGDIGFGEVTVQDAMFINGTALSASQVQDLYTMRDPRKFANPTIWFPLFSDSFTVDFSGNGHSLTTGSGSSSAGTRDAPVTWNGHGIVQRIYVPASGAITGTGQTSVSGSAAVSEAVALTGSGQSSVSASGTISEAVALVGTGQSSVSGAGAVSEAAALTGSGQTSVSGGAAVSESAALSGTGQTSVSASGAVSEAVALVGTGQVSVSGSATFANSTTQIDGAGNSSVSASGTVSVA